MAASSNSSSTKPKEWKTIEDAQKELLRSPRFSDLTVTCGDRTWKCQRALLCQRSTFFDAICTGEFVEAQVQIVDFPDDDPESIELMLSYLYTLQLPTFHDRDDVSICDESFNAAVAVFQIGDKYMLNDLRDAGKQAMLSGITKLPNCPFREFRKGEYWIKHTKRLWQLNCEGMEEIRTAMLDELVGLSNLTIEMEEFRAALQEDQAFNMDYIRALTEKVRAYRQDISSKSQGLSMGLFDD